MNGTPPPEDAPTVLVVEDEEILARTYSHYLADEYAVRTAMSGAEALDAVDETVDVVLLDRRMPEMTGDAVLGAIRERGLDCQVAMVTAVDPGEDIVSMPFDDYAVKPVEREVLRDLVGGLVERAAYSEGTRTYLRLASKKAALELAGNDGTEEYDRLTERIDALRDDLDQRLETIGPEAAYRDLPVEE